MRALGRHTTLHYTSVRLMAGLNRGREAVAATRLPMMIERDSHLIPMVENAATRLEVWTLSL